MSIFDDIRRDREAGTPGDWKVFFGTRVVGDSPQPICDFHDQGAGPFMAEANARRAARLNSLEEIALAAEELAAAVDEWGNTSENRSANRRLVEAHASFSAALRKAAGGE